MELSTFNLLTWAWIGMALLLVPVQLFITAPYGRHTRQGWGPAISNRLGWILMEIVSPSIFALFFLIGPVSKTLPMWIIFACWMGHYIHRSIIYPFRLRTKGKKMPISIILSAVFFNTINGFLNGYWLGYLSPSYPDSWLSDPRFLIGCLLFLAGAAINYWADDHLIHLRQKGEGGYKIPKTGLFHYISCPNHLGEIVEWFGFALLCWNLPALSFAIWTAANLIPRAHAHHRWYQSHFEEYPEKRNAVIPGIF